MRSVSTRFSKGVAVALLCSNLFITSALAADIRPRDPSFGERLTGFFARIVRALSDEIYIPPPQPGH